MMAMLVIKLSLLIHALMGRTLMNQIIAKLNSLILPGNPLWTPLGAGIPLYQTLLHSSLCLFRPPLSLY